MLERITFVSSNENKVSQIRRSLNVPVDHVNLDIAEIQSLDSRDVVFQKAIEAYKQLKRPVLVDDSSLSFSALGKLPGPFINQFLQELGPEGLCRLLDNYQDRSAIATSALAFHTGVDIVVFNASITGQIANKPRGNNGYGWDTIFIPEGYEKTRGEMDEKGKERDNTSVRKKVLEKLEIYRSQLISISTDHSLGEPIALKIKKV